MGKRKAFKIKAEIVREVYPACGRRPEVWVVISHSPHARGQWEISNLCSSVDAAQDLIKRCDLARATIVRIPAEISI